MTTAVAAAGVAAATGSLVLAGGVALGGFFIDLDHAVDYVLFERQRDLRPAAFLRHYTEGRVRRCVLVLHSYELFVTLGVLAFQIDSPLLAGYLLGALMHLGLDLRFNGELTPRSIIAFYSFGYRLAHRFDAVTLLGPHARPAADTFWRAFFAEFQPRPRAVGEATPRV